MTDTQFGVLLAVIAVILLVLVFGLPAIERARAEREQREAELAAERERLRTEKSTTIQQMQGDVPAFVLRARAEFERDYRAGKHGDWRNGDWGQDKSPLICFGYRVGKTQGRLQAERLAILRHALAVDMDAAVPFLPASYRAEWGAPLSITRFNRTYTHLIGLAARFGDRNSHQVAVAEWSADAAWFHGAFADKVTRYHRV